MYSLHGNSTRLVLTVVFHGQLNKFYYIWAIWIFRQFLSKEGWKLSTLVRSVYALLRIFLWGETGLHIKDQFWKCKNNSSWLALKIKRTVQRLQKCKKTNFFGSLVVLVCLIKDSPVKTCLRSLIEVNGSASTPHDHLLQYGYMVH